MTAHPLDIIVTALIAYGAIALGALIYVHFFVKPVPDRT